MDCRSSLILGLAVGILGAAAGCSTSPFARKTADDPSQNLVKESPKAPAVEAPTQKVAKEKDLPKRSPKAQTCVAFGDFRLRESKAVGRTPEDQRKMRDQAKKAYHQALRIDPKCLEAHRGLALVYDADKDEEQAIKVYQGAVRIAPKEPTLWFELGMLHSRRKEWKLATDALTNAAELNPDNRQYANILGFALARAGQYEQALTYFSQVVGEAKAHYNVGRMMIHVGQVEPGKELVQAACEKDPNLVEARELLTQLERGNVETKPDVIPVQYEEEKLP